MGKNIKILSWNVHKIYAKVLAPRFKTIVNEVVAQSHMVSFIVNWRPSMLH